MRTASIPLASKTKSGSARRVDRDEPVKTRLIRVHKGRGGWADDAAADYLRRLRRYGGIDEVCVRPQSFQGDVDAVRRSEGARIQKLLQPRDRLIVLDERGRDLTSEAWARLVDAARRDGVPTLVMALGGPYGHDPALRSKAHTVVRLAPMVLNHQVARVVALEQLYRAWTILRGEPYHH